MSAGLLKRGTDRVREANGILAVICEYVGLNRSGAGRFVGLFTYWFHRDETRVIRESTGGKN
jgi:hypothetical protein